MTKSERDLRDTLGGVSIDRMNGDNLAITLCTYFEDADEDVDDETGWTPSAVAGCDEALAAIHAHYAAEIRRLHGEIEAARLAGAAPEVSDDDIIVLFQQGNKLDEIAQATGLPKSTVHARLKKRGLTQARRRIKWTANMRNELIGLRAIKVPMSAIAKRLKVSRSAIYAELARIERQ